MRLVSYNVGLVNPEAMQIDVYALINDIIGIDADVVALHEFEYELCPQLGETLQKRYEYSHYLKRKDKGYSCALFSRWKMIGAKELYIDDSFEGLPVETDRQYIKDVAVTEEEKEEAWKRGIMGATIELPDGKKIKVITCHLMSNGFNQLLIYDGMSPWRRFPLFWERFLMSCRGRDTEVKYLRKWVDFECMEMPVVVCGDTNSFWWSKTIRIMKNGMPKLYDAMESASRFGLVGLLRRWASTFGYGHTLYAHKVMFFRLDYVLHSASVKVIKYDVPHWKHSDHYPVIVDMEPA